MSSTPALRPVSLDGTADATAPPIPVSLVQFHVDWMSLVEAPLASSVIDGTEPHGARVTLAVQLDPQVVIADLFRIERSYVYASTGGQAVYPRHLDGDAGCVALLAEGESRIDVSARTAARRDELVAHFAALAPAAPADQVRLKFWRQRRDGPRSSGRTLVVPAWDEIVGNYPAEARGPLDELMCVERPTGRGNLVLWHGAAGTGKTTALRALLRSWRPWTTAHIVTDPEALFSEPDYLLEVLGDGGSERDRQPLIVCEDADEYLRADAREKSGAALGRLLNVTDGLLGQGTGAIIVITTNDPLAKLHSAVTRPGRCLSVVEFPPFGAAEAADWLRAHGVDAPLPLRDGATLAELVELAGSTQRIVTPERRSPGHGNYL